MIKEMNVRELALEVLLEIEKGEKSHLILRSVLEKYQYLTKQERAFLTRVTEGTVERRLELDYIINQYSKVKVKKMKPVIRNLLRLAVYQMKYMDNVPDSAACNEAVKLAVKRGFGNLRGFVNGVLRNIARNLDHIEYPEKEQTIPYLSVMYSMPEWIVKMWVSDYGREKTEEILQNFYIERPTTIRINENQISKMALIDKLEREGVKVEEHPFLQSALLISNYDYLGALDSFLEGDFQVQDAASIQVAESAGIKEDDYIIDVCAAPGGKALHAAQILNGTGFVEARDLTEYKVSLIRENIWRMGFTNIEAVQQDATIYDEASEAKADVIIADLPCSGLGVLAKKTDLKYKMTPETEKEVAELQRQILKTVHRYVKPGGTLIYSTCTICKSENEENAKWFVENHPQFELRWEKQIFPGRETDGFYIAKFIRRSL
ncbi:MAG: 16S rRNA (cytosine(967)-C(5))-methyltransferase RsmB [bacterium]|nr:16S rRNA (cytosine(967)-C(5))-methyltransferase RsmB [bacterium]